LRHALNAAREIEAAYRADWTRLLALLARGFDEGDFIEQRKHLNRRVYRIF